MNAGIQRFCAYSGLISLGLFGFAMIVAVHFIPPLSPMLSSAEIARIFQDNNLGIRVASAVMMYSCPFGWAWSASVALRTAKMEGAMPVLSIAQIPCGLFSFGGAYFTCIAWCSAAFRADHNDQVVYLMSDQGWLWLVMMGSCAVIQMIFIGVAVLNDKSSSPVFPRWVGYFNIWVGILETPGVFVAFFKTGPFAWDGLFAFWLALTAFASWVLVDTWALLRAIKREKALTA